MVLNVAGRRIETDPQGYLCNLAQWSEEFAEEIAERDGIKLYNDHWELIWYFRDYYDENESAPTMHTMVKTLGKKNAHHHEKKAYEKHVYGLFPKDPIHEICKLSGLPMPQPDD
jgi:tRNA 2-thiouridine synthesizing protein E